MTSPRARWLAGRTRNAARHGLVIVGTGALVVTAALLTFVLLPRQADRALSTAIAALRARMQLAVPPVAMLLASLVLGISVGFAVTVWREMRHPTVGDAQELELLTRSRVIVHPGDDAVPGELGSAWRMGARLLPRCARRTRPPESHVPVLTPAAETWPLLPTSALVRSEGERSTHGGGPAGASGADPTWETAWDASRALPLGRDAGVTLVLPRRARYDASASVRAGGRGRPDTADPPRCSTRCSATSTSRCT
jgi:hypothetical protein